MGEVGMLKNFIMNQTSLPVLEKGLNAYALREKVISLNIANVNTPGYKKKQVVFEEKLQEAINKALPGFQTHPRHIPIGRNNSALPEVEIETDNSNDLASGVNNVSVEEEMVDLVKNQIRYMYGTRMVAREFSAIRASIKGRFDR